MGSSRSARPVPGPLPRPARQGRTPRRSPARPTPSGSCARSRSTRSAGRWIDPRGADMPLADVGREFLSLVPPAVADDAGDLPARPEPVRPAAVRRRTGSAGCRPTRSRTGSTTRSTPGLAPSSVHRHYRTLRRMLQVAVEKQKILANPCDRVEPPRVPKREMVVPRLGAGGRASPRRTSRALPRADLPRGRHRDALERARRPPPLRVDLRRRKVRVTEQLVRLEDGEWLRKEPKTTAGVPVDHDLGGDGALLADHLARVLPRRARRAGVPQRRRQPALVVELPHPPLPQGSGRRRRPAASTTCATRAALARQEGELPEAGDGDGFVGSPAGRQRKLRPTGRVAGRCRPPIGR